MGNETEAAAYAESFELNTTDVGEIAMKIAQLPKENGSRSRLVVITQGSDPVIAVEHGKLHSFPVAPIPKEEIVDTNGAGDAFVGGFLAQQVSQFPGLNCFDQICLPEVFENYIFRFLEKTSRRWCGAATGRLLTASSEVAAPCQRPATSKPELQVHSPLP